MAMVASSKEERVRFRYDLSMSRRTRRPQIIADNTNAYCQVQDDLPSPLNSFMGEEEEGHVMSPDIDKGQQNTMKELSVSDQNNEVTTLIDSRTESQVEEKEQQQQQQEKEEEEDEKENEHRAYEKEKEHSAYALVIVPKHGNDYAKGKNSGMLKKYIKVLNYMLKANRSSKKKLLASK